MTVKKRDFPKSWHWKKELSKTLDKKKKPNISITSFQNIHLETIGDSPVFKHFLKEWADSKVIINHLRDEAQFSPDETTKAFLLNRADEIEQELELRMVDSQMLIQSAKKIRSLIGSLLVYSLHFPQTVSILQAQSPETFDL